MGGETFFKADQGHSNAEIQACQTFIHHVSFWRLTQWHHKKTGHNHANSSPGLKKERKRADQPKDTLSYLNTTKNFQFLFGLHSTLEGYDWLECSMPRQFKHKSTMCVDLHLTQWHHKNRPRQWNSSWDTPYRKVLYNFHIEKRSAKVFRDN